MATSTREEEAAEEAQPNFRAFYTRMGPVRIRILLNVLPQDPVLRKEMLRRAMQHFQERRRTKRAQDTIFRLMDEKECLATEVRTLKRKVAALEGEKKRDAERFKGLEDRFKALDDEKRHCHPVQEDESLSAGDALDGPRRNHGQAA